MDVFLRRSPIDISLHGEDWAYPKTIHQLKFFSTEVAEPHSCSQKIQLILGQSNKVGDSGVYQYSTEGKSFIS